MEEINSHLKNTVPKQLIIDFLDGTTHDDINNLSNLDVNKIASLTIKIKHEKENN